MRIFLLVLLFISLNAFGIGGPKPRPVYYNYGNTYYFPPPTNYQYRVVRERLMALMVDSGLHVPSYNGTPSSYRTGVWPHDGAIAMDTANGRFYGWHNSAWFRVANYSELTTISFPYTTLKYLTGYNTFGSLLDTARTAISLTTTGTSGAATYNSSTGVLNIPQYSGTNIYNSNGSLTGTRTVTTGTNLLLFDGSGDETVRVATSGGFGTALSAFASDPSSIAFNGLVYNAANNAVQDIGSFEVQTSSTASSGIGARMKFIVETSTGAAAFAGGIAAQWNVATNASRTSWIDMYGVDNTSTERFMNIQPDGTVRVNNDADTLATKAYARSVGGSGGVSAADLPLRITGGTTVSADTSVAYSPSLTTNARLEKIVDSLDAAGWGNTYNINSELNYQYYTDVAGGVLNLVWITGSGAGTGVTRMSTPPGSDWLFGMQYSTGTTSGGYTYSHSGNSGTVAGINMTSSYRYNFGTKVRLEDLSDGSETYRVHTGYADSHTDESAIVDGIYFTYTHSDSSGQWVCKTKSNSSVTAVASGITVAADTDYELEVTSFGGVALFYINKSLVASIETTIPSGSSRTTAINHTIKKSNGTTARLMYTEWLAVGKRNF